MANHRADGAIVERIDIAGLREFEHSLGEAKAALPRVIRSINRSVAQEIVDSAREHADRPQQRKAATSLRVVGGAASIAVSLRNKFGFELGAEFGSKRYKQFPPWRGNQWSETWVPEGVGYFLHPAIRDDAARIIGEYNRRLDEVWRIAFPD